jgi:glycine/D-amino acid oxidase-like deaminating enzyme
MAEQVLVIGAGMAGLWTALALAPTGREVVLLERDPAAARKATLTPPSTTGTAAAWVSHCATATPSSRACA